MTDAGFVVGAYAVVLGGLLVYVVSIGRRAREARRTSQALKRQREQGSEAAAGTSSAIAAPPPDPSR